IIGRADDPLEAAAEATSQRVLGQSSPPTGTAAVDFSSIRIHTDALAARASRAVNARAFASGRHLVFGAGEYRPDTLAGRRLLTHELAHVATTLPCQERGVSGWAPILRQVIPGSVDPFVPPVVAPMPVPPTAVPLDTPPAPAVEAAQAPAKEPIKDGA